MISYRKYLKITRRSEIFRSWPKLERHFLILKIRDEFDKCLVSNHEFTQKRFTHFTIFRNFPEIFGNFLKNLWKFMEICGNLWKSRMGIPTDFHKLPEILRGLRISRNFHRFPFPEIWECSHLPSLD